MKLTRFKLAFLSYALFDLLIGGHCGGLLPLTQLAAAQMTPAQGSITAASASCLSTNCVTLQLDGATGAASIQLTGTFTATVSFEVSNDNGTTYVAINGTPPNSTTAVTSATATGLWQFNVAGFTHIRARGSAYTSGTAAVVINSARASAKSGGGGVTVGAFSANCLPLAPTATTLNCSSITDNGTTVTSTEPFISPSGTVALPGVGIGATNNGFSKLSGGVAYGNASADSNAMFLVGLSNVEAFRIGSTKSIGWASGADPNTNSNDTFLGRRAAASLRMGAADVNGAPVAQTLGVQNAITGTDLPGSKWVLEAPLGTGAGAGAATAINRAQILATGTTAQTGANAFVVCETKILSNTSATTTTIATIGLASNSGGGVTVFHSLTASDGTNFDSETQSYNVSYVNKAGAITVGTAQITASSAANNSGSATIGATITGASPTISLKVTPVFTTIVPTTVTAYTTIINHGAGVVTCQ